MRLRRCTAPCCSPRAIALFIVGSTAYLLGTARGLQPNPTGMGTHLALGLPTCTFILKTGYPCPTCGVTTSFAYFVRGRLLASFHAQPAGFVLAGALALVLFAASWTLVTGRPPVLRSRSIPPGNAASTDEWRRWFTPQRVTTWAIGVILFGWTYKIVAGLLLGTLPVRT